MFDLLNLCSPKLNFLNGKSLQAQLLHMGGQVVPVIQVWLGAYPPIPPVTHPFRTTFYRITFFIYMSTRTTVDCCCPQLDTLAAVLLQSRRLRSPGPLAPAKTDGSSHPEAILLRLKFAALPPKHGQPQVLLPGTELKAE